MSRALSSPVEKRGKNLDLSIKRNNGLQRAEEIRVVGKLGIAAGQRPSSFGSGRLPPVAPFVPQQEVIPVRVTEPLPEQSGVVKLAEQKLSLHYTGCVLSRSSSVGSGQPQAPECLVESPFRGKALDPRIRRNVDTAADELNEGAQSSVSSSLQKRDASRQEALVINVKNDNYCQNLAGEPTQIGEDWIKDYESKRQRSKEIARPETQILAEAELRGVPRARSKSVFSTGVSPLFSIETSQAVVSASGKQRETSGLGHNVGRTSEISPPPTNDALLKAFRALGKGWKSTPTKRPERRNYNPTHRIIPSSPSSSINPNTSQPQPIAKPPSQQPIDVLTLLVRDALHEVYRFAGTKDTEDIIFPFETIKLYLEYDACVRRGLKPSSRPVGYRTFARILNSEPHVSSGLCHLKAPGEWCTDRPRVPPNLLDLRGRQSEPQDDALLRQLEICHLEELQLLDRALIIHEQRAEILRQMKEQSNTRRSPPPPGLVQVVDSAEHGLNRKRPIAAVSSTPIIPTAAGEASGKEPPTKKLRQSKKLPVSKGQPTKFTAGGGGGGGGDVVSRRGAITATVTVNDNNQQLRGVVPAAKVQRKPGHGACSRPLVARYPRAP